MTEPGPKWFIEDREVTNDEFIRYQLTAFHLYGNNYQTTRRTDRGHVAYIAFDPRHVTFVDGGFVIRRGGEALTDEP